MLLNLGKIFYIIFFVYIMWFQYFVSQINGGPLIFGFLMMFFLILTSLNKKRQIKLYIGYSMYTWFVFFIYILIVGYVVALDKLLLIESVFTYGQTLLVIFFIINISLKEKSNLFFIRTYAALSIVYASSIIFWGYRSGNIITLSANSNPNSDGMMLMIGIFTMLVLLSYNKNPLFFLLYISSIGYLLYTITLTSSRKAFLFTILLILLWGVFSLIPLWLKSSLKLKLTIMTIISFMSIIICKIIPNFFQSHLFFRLTNKEGQGGDEIRLSMYEEAFVFFKNNPLFGIGFNQYRELSVWKTYSHSTYAELFANTGIIGSVIYFIPYTLVLFGLLQLYRNKDIIRHRINLYMSMYIIFLLYGTSVIHFYSIRDSILMGIFISFILISKSTSERGATLQ